MTPEPDRLALILARRAAGETFIQIGRDLGLSRQRAHQLYHRALRLRAQAERQRYLNSLKETP